VGVNIETVLSDVLLEVDTAVEAVLAKITISDVVQRLKPCVAKKTNTTVGRIEKKNGRQRITLSQMRAGTKSRRVKALRTA